MKAKKWLVVVLSAVMALAVALGIGACGVKKGYDHKDDTWVWTANADGTTHNGKASCDDRSHDVTNEAHVWGTDNKCTKCGATKPQETHDHTYDAWDYNNTQHWKYCDDHGTDKTNIDTSSKKDHTWKYVKVDGAKHNKVSTCTEHAAVTIAENHTYDQENNTKCRCGAEKPSTPPEPCQHTNTEWRTSDTQHWQFCLDCETEVPGTRANHTGWGNYQNNGADHTKTSTCTEHTAVTVTENHSYGANGECACGAKQSTPTPDHVYAETWEHDATEHWHPCTTHPDAGKEDSQGRTTHTYDQNGNTECVCGAKNPNPPQPETLEAGWYIVGKIAALNGENWGTYVADRFVGANGLTVSLTMADSFKFAQYDGGTDIKINWDGSIGYTDELKGHFMDGGGGNIAVKSTKCEGSYTFTIVNGKLNVKTDIPEDTSKPDLDEGWYIVGDVLNNTNWATYLKDRFIPEEGRTIALKMTDTFKFSKYIEADTATVVWGEGRSIGYSDEYSSVCKKEDKENSDNFQVKEDGTYIIKFTGDHLSIEKKSEQPEPCQHTHTEWQTSDTQHWQFCTDCNEEVPGTRANHTGWDNYQNKTENHTKDTTCTQHDPVTVTEGHTYDQTGDKCKCGAEKPVDADTRAFYVLGNIEGGDFNWDTASKNQMTLGADGHSFSITVFMYKYGAFKIVYFDKAQTTEPGDLWEHQIGFSEYDGENKTFTEGDMGNIVAPETGTYTITLYTNDTNHPEDDDTFSIIITKDETATFEWDLHVYGDMNKWGAGEDKLAMTKGADGKYTATVTVTAEDLAEPKDQKGNKYVAFKVVNIHDGNVKYFGGEVTEDNKDGNFWLTKADTYTITFDTNKMEVGIKGENEDKPGPQPEPDADTRVFYVYGSATAAYWHDDGEHLPLKLNRTADHTFTITLTLYKGETFKIIGFEAAPEVQPENFYGIEVDFNDCYNADPSLISSSGINDFTVVKDGVYTFTLYTNDDTNSGNDDDGFSIGYERTGDVEWKDVYVFGTMNQWKKVEDYKMDGTGTTRTFTLDVTEEMINNTKDDKGAKANPAIKVVNVMKYGDKYFGNAEGNNIEFTQAGKYNITFDTTTYEVTAVLEGQKDVAHDPRTFVLSGSSTETDAALFGNGFGYDTAKLAFSRTIGTNTFVLKNVRLYAGDKFQIRYNASWDDGTENSSTHYAYGAYFLIKDSTSNVGQVFDTSNSSAWWGDAVVATGKSGVYDITIQSLSTTITSKTTVGENQVKFTFTRTQQLSDPDRSVIDFYLVGTIKSMGMNNKWPGVGVTNSDFVHLNKTADNTYSVTCTFASGDQFKVYCSTFGSWHTQGVGKNENANITVGAGQHTITVKVQAGAQNLSNGDSKVTVTIS